MMPPRAATEASSHRAIVAFGRQDVDPDGLTPPPGITILGASSDHLILDPGAARRSSASEMRLPASTTPPSSGP